MSTLRGGTFKSRHSKQGRLREFADKEGGEGQKIKNFADVLNGSPLG